MLIDRVLVCHRIEHTEYSGADAASASEGASGGSPEAPSRQRGSGDAYEDEEASGKAGAFYEAGAAETCEASGISGACGANAPDDASASGTALYSAEDPEEAPGFTGYSGKFRKKAGKAGENVGKRFFSSGYVKSGKAARSFEKKPRKLGPQAEEEAEYEVTFEGAGTVYFSSDEVMTYWLYDTEQEIDLDQLRQQALERRFIRAALNYCLYAKRTESSAADKMREYYNAYSPCAQAFWGAFAADATDSAVEYLREQGYIGDEKFAGSFVRAHLDKGVSAAYLENELLKRGVRKDAARAAVEEIRGDDGSACRQALEKKVRSKPPVLDDEGRLDIKYELSLIRFLGSRGFSGELARKTVEDWAGARGSLSDE